MQDLWQYLKAATDRGRSIVLYGMGNGADKILAVCAARGIPVSDFFASDGFVRGHSFHGRVVISYSAMREKYATDAAGLPIVLIAFASSRPEVLALMERVNRECETYIPDVPVCGRELFDAAFYENHRWEIDEARELFADDESRRVYDGILDYKLSGRMEVLRATESEPNQAYTAILHAETFRTVADLGAYNGDSIRALRAFAPHLSTAIALEPDRRNFRKLEAYAASLREAGDSLCVLPIAAGAWSEDTTLTFHDSGNRNAGLAQAPADRSAADISVADNSAAGTFAVDTPVPAMSTYGTTPCETPPCETLHEGTLLPSTADNPYFGKTAEVTVRALDHIVAEAVAAGQLPPDGRVDFIKYDVEGAEREALLGSRAIIERDAPTLLVSAYHRSADLFRLPRLVHELRPDYRLYLRRMAGVPAWDINLYAVADG